MKKVSIIIPAYNEEKRIGKTLECYDSYFKNLKKEKKLDSEIIIVINGATDSTEEIVKKYSKKNKEIKYLNFKQGGKGFAVIQGFREALKGKSDLIGFVDADMATPPEAFYDLIRNIRNFDGVIANRWDKRSKIKTRQTLLRRFVSRGYNLIVRTLFFFPYRDTQCGAKLFKRDVLERNIDKLMSSNMNFDVALLFCLKKEENAKIKSIPTIWNDKKESKVNLKRTPIKMLLSAIRLRIIHSPFKFVVMVYRRLPKWLQLDLRLYN